MQKHNQNTHDGESTQFCDRVVKYSSIKIIHGSCQNQLDLRVIVAKRSCIKITRFLRKVIIICLCYKESYTFYLHCSTGPAAGGGGGLGEGLAEPLHGGDWPGVGVLARVGLAQAPAKIFPVGVFFLITYIF